MTTDTNKPAPPTLDLDAVERAERAMTPGPWRHGSVERHHVFCSEGDRSLLCPEAGRVLLRMNEHFPHDSNAAGIVALRNAAPALIAEVRRLRALLQVLARAASRYVPPGDASDPAVTSAPSQAWGRAISVAACKRVPPREAQAIAHAIHAAADAAEES